VHGLILRYLVLQGSVERGTPGHVLTLTTSMKLVAILTDCSAQTADSLRLSSDRFPLPYFSIARFSANYLPLLAHWMNRAVEMMLFCAVLATRSRPEFPQARVTERSIF
jgi:hypothetical protein